MTVKIEHQSSYSSPLSQPHSQATGDGFAVRILIKEVSDEI